jgi:amino acid adenylation domain-containing protein
MSATQFPPPGSLNDVLQLRAQRQPERPVYRFLHDGDTEQGALTYAELDQEARRIATLLLQRARPGDRALLLYAPGLEFITAFFGCLYAGVIAVPAYPPPRKPRDRALERIQAIARSAEPALALTCADELAAIEQRYQLDTLLPGAGWLATDRPAQDDACATADLRPATPDTVAFLQYTSGSTATPKGVIVTHGQILHNEAVIQRGFGHDESTVVVGWLPLYHDMGLIGNLIQPLFVGGQSILMPPVAFLQQPARWLRAITRYRATTSGGPNFAFDLCTQKIPPDERALLDLTSWRVAFNGAEPVRARTLERFADAFEGCGFRRAAFYPCYGLAEATLMVSGGAPDAPPLVADFDSQALAERRARPGRPGGPSSSLVGCGAPLLGHQARIVAPDSRRACAEGEIGEIWVAGPSVAGGYWGQPAETERTFQARLADAPEQTYLRTGDLGFWHAGQLFIAGRLKDQIIIRGRNYYPAELEQTAERSHPALRQGACAAFAIDIDDQERLAIAIEVDRHYQRYDLREVAAAVRQAVAHDHEIQAHTVVLLRPASIPKTSSGKIQRYACREALRAGTLDIVGTDQLGDAAEPPGQGEAPPARDRASLERYLCRQIAGRVPVADPASLPDRPLGQLGLDSLMAVELQHTIERDLGVALSVADLLGDQTVAQLAAALETAGRAPDHSQPAEPIEAAPVYPLSAAQQAIWFVQQLAPESRAYTIPVAVRLSGALDHAALEQSLRQIVRRHAALRATFTVEEGRPAQRIQPAADLPLRLVDLSSLSADQQAAALECLIAEHLREPFDLAAGPLMRAVLVRQHGTAHTLALALHHLVTDGWSMRLLAQELAARYAAAVSGSSLAPEPPAPAYPAAVVRQREWLAGPAVARQLAYWREQLDGLAPLRLPLAPGRARPAAPTFAGASLQFLLDPPTLAALRALGQRHGTTLFMTLLAVFQLLLMRYAGTDDVAVGAPAAARSRALESLIGCFVNTLVLRTRLDGNPTFSELLGRVRRVALEAYAHQDIPFERLVEELRPARDPRHNPLVQVLFALQPVAASDLSLAGVEAEALPVDLGGAKFDLALSFEETPRGLCGTLTYATALFDAPMMERFAQHFQSLLGGALADPARRIAELPLLTEQERAAVTTRWNTPRPERAALPVHHLIERQALLSPDAVALVVEHTRLSYAELNARANRLAHALAEAGVGPETRVGLYAERSPELIVGLLGILKAGGAYVPFDTHTPPARIAAILQDSAAAALVVGGDLGARLPDLPIPQIAVGGRGEDGRPWPNPAVPVAPEQAAYVLYTSGSTGQPKGVVVEHRQIATYVQGIIARLAIPPGRSFALASTVAADLGNTSLFPSLCTGGCLHVLTHERLLDPAALADYMARQAIDYLKIVPSHMAAVLAATQDASALPRRQLILGGESPSAGLLADLARLAPACQIVNHYGPTEATVGVLTHPVDPAAGPPVPLGRPLPGAQVYILDAGMQLAPVGVPGELYIGGETLARGYLGQPALTAERFVPDPFAERSNDTALERLSDLDDDRSTVLPFYRSSARLYRTGDIGRWLPDGTVEFLGRADHQVKIRGFRIELGEIERVLERHPSVRTAAVVLRDTPPRLVAYLAGAPGQQPDSRALRQFLREHLPEHMVPAALVALPDLPRTANGKIDRRALPEPAGAAESRPEIAPQSRLERLIAEVWRDLLKVERPGLHDNFFDLGGHSLLLAQVRSQLHQRAGVDVAIVDLFSHPTIAGLAALLDARGRSAPAAPAEAPQPEALRAGKQRLQQLLRKKTEPQTQ